VYYLLDGGVEEAVGVIGDENIDPLGQPVFNVGDSDAAAAAPPPQGPRPYPVVSLPTQSVTSYTQYPARIEGVVNNDVRAKISGYVTDVLVDEGQRVRRGQPMFRLETQTLNEDAAAAEANVNAAQVEVDKLKPLVDKDIISEVQLRTAEARLAQAKSGLSGISANINYGNISSPISGYVGRINSREGALVSPTSQQPMTTVSDISEVYAYFSMNESDYLDFMQAAEGNTVDEKIKNLPTVTLVLSNGSLYEEKGKIQTVINQVNAQTGTIQFRAVFDNSSRLLNSGNSGTIRVPKVFEEAVVVPKTATYDQQGTTYVLRVGADSTTAAVALDVMSDVDNLFVVSEGVSAGDRIIAKGVNNLRPGVKVIPQEMPFDSIAKPLPTVFR